MSDSDQWEPSGKPQSTVVDGEYRCDHCGGDSFKINVSCVRCAECNVLVFGGSTGLVTGHRDYDKESKETEPDQ